MTIIVCPTEKCNFRCTGCFQSNEVHQGVGIKYNFNAMKRSLLEVWKGSYHGSDVCLHGGEPLMLPIEELEKLLNLIHNLPWEGNKVKGSVSIVTNGSYITDKHIELFKKHNVYVGLSCDGPPETNIHRGPDPSDEAVTLAYNLDLMGKIRRLRENNIPTSIMCILHKDNAGTSEALMKLQRWILSLKKLGVKGGRMNPMYSNRHPELELTNHELYRAWINIYHWNKKFNLRWNPLIEMDNNLRKEKGDRSYFAPRPCVYNRCNIFNTHTLSVLPDGTIGTCDRTFDYGLYVRSLDRNKSGRYEALSQLDCKDCKYWDICGGSCPCEGIGGDWRRKTRFCEAIYKTYDYIAEKEGIIYEHTTPRFDDHVDSGHGDNTHGDKPHGDTGHGDKTHGNKPHADIPHADSSHGDDPDYV